jgi:hypothetical protein
MTHLAHRFLDVLFDALVVEPLVKYVKRKCIDPALRRVSSSIAKRLHPFPECKE